MNILSKKSWHTLNVANKEKVRKDQLAVKIHEEQQDQEVLSREKKRKLDILRKNADMRDLRASETHYFSSADQSSATTMPIAEEITQQPKRFCLFDEPFPVKRPTKHQQEKVALDKFEKEFDISLSKAKGPTPWYALSQPQFPTTASSVLRNKKDDFGFKNNHADSIGISHKLNDPTSLFIKKQLHVSNQGSSNDGSVENAFRNTKSPAVKSTSMEVLRQERINREMIERDRVDKLLNKRKK